MSVLEIRKTAHYAKHKGFILFGEHARELISPEVLLYFFNWGKKKTKAGLKLVKGLCSADENKRINSEL